MKITIIGANARNAERTGVRIIYQQEGPKAALLALLTRRARAKTALRQADPKDTGRGIGSVTTHEKRRRHHQPPRHLYLVR